MVERTALTIVLYLAAGLRSGSSQETGGPYVGRNNKCIIPESGNTPAIDLNFLYNRRKDYRSESKQDSNYEYLFNICGNVVFTDNTCVAGAGICLVNRAIEGATEVYGMVDSIVVRRTSAVRAEMTMTAGGNAPSGVIEEDAGLQQQLVAEQLEEDTFGDGSSNSVASSSANDTRVPKKTTIIFSCDEEARLPLPQLLIEDYLKCTVTIEVKTAFMCPGGEPPPMPNPEGFEQWELDVIFGGSAAAGAVLLYLVAGFMYLGHRGYAGWDRIPVCGCCASSCRAPGEYTEI
eukprot:gene16314-11466_t